MTRLFYFALAVLYQSVTHHPGHNPDVEKKS